VAEERTGVARRTADIIAAIIFVAILGASMLLLRGTLTETPPRQASTIKSTKETIIDVNGKKRQSEKVETTKADVSLSVWERLLGRRTVLLLVGAVALLAAFLTAAAVQRVLLGHYAFSLGPLTVSEITAERVTEAAAAALPAGASPSAAPGVDQLSEFPWINVSDPNLALAGWRIQFEQELRRLAQERNITGDLERMSIRQLLERLIEAGAIDPHVAEGLRELTYLANRGVHGASVDPSVIEVLRTRGVDVLQYLRSLHTLHGDPNSSR
jgi:hypothetical protein